MCILVFKIRERRNVKKVSKFYSCEYLGFDYKEAGELLKLKGYKHLYKLIVEQLAHLINVSLYLPHKQEGKNLKNKLSTEPLNFTIPELIKISYTILNPEIRKELYDSTPNNY